MKDRKTPQARVQDKIASLRARVADLEKQCLRRKQAEQVLRSIVEATGAVVGREFFRSLVRHLADALYVRYAFVSQVVDNAGRTARLLAIWAGDHHGPESEYRLEGTPCQEVLSSKSIVCYPNGLPKKFPADQWIRHGDVQSYLAIPLCSPDGDILGLMGVMHNAPMERSFAGESALKVFAARAAAELSRARVEQNLLLLDSAVNQAIDGLAVAGLDGNLIFVNAACSAMHGYAPAKLEGKSLSVFHNSDQIPAFEKILRQLKQSGEFRGECWHTRADGSTFPTFTHMTTLRDDAGEAVGLIANIRDITQRKRAQQALRESERALTTLMTNLPGMVYRCRNDSDWTMQFVSDGCFDLTGYPPADLLDNRKVSYASLIHPEDREAVWQGVQQGVAGREPFRLTYRISTADGQEKWVWEQGRGVFSPDDELLALEGFVTDVTERRRAEEALRESRERFRAIADYTYDLESWVSPDGRLLWVNPAAQRLTGYTVPECMAMTDFPLSIIHEEDRERMARIFRGAAQSDTGHDVRFRLRRKDGSVAWMAVSWQPLLDTQGGPLGYRASIRDVTERKRAEDERHQSETLLRTIINATREAMISIDEQGLITLFNPAAEEMFGRKADDMIGQHLDCLMPESYRKTHRKYVRSYFATGKPDDAIGKLFELPALRSDGTEFRMEISLAAGRYDDRRFVIAVARDITKRRHDEKKLQESQQMLQLVLNNIPQRIFWKDRNSTYGGGNMNFVRDAGAERPEDLEGKTDYDLPWRKEEADFYRECDRRVMDTDTPEYHIIESELRADGTQAWVETNKVPLHDAEGNVVGILGTYEDITERIRDEQNKRRAEQELRESQERLKLALEAANDGLWDWDVPSGQAYFSPRYYTMLGYEPDEPPPSYETWISLLHPDDRDQAERSVAACIKRKQEAFEIEFRMRTKSGQWRWILSRGKAMGHDKDGRVKRMVGTHVDITERRLLEEQLRQTQKMESLGTLTSGIAHDFNNLLTVIMGNASFMAGKVEPGSHLHNALTDIEKASASASSLIQRLLAFSRRSVLQMRPTDLQQCVDETIALLKRTLGAGIEIDVREQPTPWIIHADPDQMNQVIVNLCVNARDSMPSGGTITIDTENVVIDEAYCRRNQDARPGEYVQLTVADTGTGMDRKTRDRIFEPFFTTKKAGVGTGLGLSMVYGIVTQHGGWITVDSKPRRGTTFRIFLPRSATHDERPASETEVDLPKGIETILLVDDEQPILDMADRILLDCGYNTVTATEGRLAVDMFRDYQDDIDLVMLDITLPDMDGYQVLAAIREIKPDVKVILCSADVMQETTTQAKKLAADVPRLSKPLRAEALARAVRKTLDA
ncbi:MAG: PAS domain S-box protein [Phycisphaerales bacterium]|nr:MAG: PAS domain S-box protein [Phycisphaerales bacterium]